MEAESKMTAVELLTALKGLSLEDLDKVVAAAEQEREAGRKALLEETRAKAEALGLSLRALLEGAGDQDHSASERARSPVRPQYRHSETGEIWSGRGSAPAWGHDTKVTLDFARFTELGGQAPIQNAGSEAMKASASSTPNLAPNRPAGPHAPRRHQRTSTRSPSDKRLQPCHRRSRAH
jgi:DNA-binding protein H-NS